MSRIVQVQKRSTQYTGGLTPAQQVTAWNSAIQAGFEGAFDRPLNIVYDKIAMVQTPDDWRQPDMPADAVPKEVNFGFSPPNGKGHKLVTKRNARPLTTHSISVSLDTYMDTLSVKRADWQRDVKGLLRKVPRDLRRTAEKNPDVILAGLLRNGKTANDYTGASAFFAASKPCSPEGAISDVYKNLFTSTPLTESNLAKVVQNMRAIKGPDGLTLGVNPDTLIIPLSLEHDAMVATKLANIVYSTGNPAPGQAAGTAAQGENPMAQILKWVKKVVILDTLQDGQAINDTSWYVTDTSDGAVGLLYALGQPAEFESIMNPHDPTVFFDDEYFWGWRKVEGANYGLPQFITRCDA